MVGLFFTASPYNSQKQQINTQASVSDYYQQVGWTRLVYPEHSTSAQLGWTWENMEAESAPFRPKGTKWSESCFLIVNVSEIFYSNKEHVVSISILIIDLQHVNSWSFLDRLAAKQPTEPPCNPKWDTVSVICGDRLPFPWKQTVFCWSYSNYRIKTFLCGTTMEKLRRNSANQACRFTQRLINLNLFFLKQN